MNAVVSFGAPAAAAHRLEPVEFGAIAGFQGEDLFAAFRVFRASCAAIAANHPELRRGKPASAALRRVAQAALGAQVNDRADAELFFETHFAPHRIVALDSQGQAQTGFLTGYYEPIVAASPIRTDDFRTPILSRPADLVTLNTGQSHGALAGLAAARRTSDGGLEPYPDRAAIDDGALDGKVQAIAWVRDPIERFLIQVQGSARLRWTNGEAARLTYDGRNGLPYTSIGRILVEDGHIPASDMSLAALKQWVRANGQEGAAAGARLMRRNRSFVFFRLDPLSDPMLGPIGAAGLPLTPLRSIAVDRTLWSYGLPFWIEAEMPWQSSATSKFQRLMLAQDTGSAVVGPARADLFFGSGDEAGARAGDIRHAGDFIVLLPHGEDAP